MMRAAENTFDAPAMPPLVDSFGRRHTSLRISVTDRCNIRCFYCMPAEGVVFRPRTELLTFEEIERFARALVPLGVDKLRLTGGEPLVRADLPELVRMLAAIPGIRDLALTTNGMLLDKQAAALQAAGLRRINISLDTLSEETFEIITRRQGLDLVLAGIAAAQEAGFDEIRLNAIAIRGLTEQEIIPLASFARDRKLELRFIEFMPLDAEHHWSTQQVLTGAEQLHKVWSRRDRWFDLGERDLRTLQGDDLAVCHEVVARAAQLQVQRAVGGDRGNHATVARGREVDVLDAGLAALGQGDHLLSGHSQLLPAQLAFRRAFVERIADDLGGADLEVGNRRRRICFAEEIRGEVHRAELDRPILATEQQLAFVAHDARDFLGRVEGRPGDFLASLCAKGDRIALLIEQPGEMAVRVFREAQDRPLGAWQSHRLRFRGGSATEQRQHDPEQEEADGADGHDGGDPAEGDRGARTQVRPGDESRGLSGTYLSGEARHSWRWARGSGQETGLWVGCDPQSPSTSRVVQRQAASITS